MGERTLTIRLHCELVDDLKIFEGIPVFLVKEIEANRPHFQGFVKYSKTLDNLRKLIKSKNPRLVGNKAYSVKEMTDSNYVQMFQYYCKGTKETRPEVIFNTYVVDDVEGLYVKYWEQNKELKKKVKKESNLYKLVFQEKPENVCSRGVAEHIVNWSIKNERMISHNQMKSLIQFYLINSSSHYKDEYIKYLSCECDLYSPELTKTHKLKAHIREEEYHWTPTSSSINYGDTSHSDLLNMN